MLKLCKRRKKDENGSDNVKAVGFVLFLKIC